MESPPPPPPVRLVDPYAVEDANDQGIPKAHEEEDEHAQFGRERKTSTSSVVSPHATPLVITTGESIIIKTSRMRNITTPG